MANSGMLICSFYLNQRFRRAEDYVYPLNHKYEINDEIVYSDVFDMFLDFCGKNFSFSDDEKNMNGSSQKSSPTGKMAVLRMGNLQNGRLILDKLVYSSDNTEISCLDSGEIVKLKYIPAKQGERMTYYDAFYSEEAAQKLLHAQVV